MFQLMKKKMITIIIHLGLQEKYYTLFKNIALEYCIGVLSCLWYSVTEVELEIPMYLPSLSSTMSVFVYLS